MSAKQNLIAKVIDLYKAGRLDFINTSEGQTTIEWGGSGASSWRTTMGSWPARELWVRDIRNAIAIGSEFALCWDGMTVAGLKSIIREAVRS